MNVTAVAPTRDSHLLLVPVLVILAAAPLWFIHQKLHYVTDYSLRLLGSAAASRGAADSAAGHATASEGTAPLACRLRT